jgi:hypothetical protein
MTTEETTQSASRNPRFAHQPPGLLGKIIAFVLGAGFLVLAFMFSLVALAVLAVGGLMVWGWLWWKTRAIRQQMKEMQANMQNQAPVDGQIIEGEVIRETTAPLRPERLLR